MPEETNNLPDVPRGELLPIGAKFWDASTKEHGVITAEMQAIAAAISNQIVLGDAMRIDGLFRLRFYRGYRGWGYHCFEDCAEAMFGVGRSQAHALAGLGEKRFLLGGIAEEKGKSAKEYTTALDAQTSAIQRTILRLPYEELVKAMEGMWESPDGQKLSPAEVLKVVGRDQAEKEKSLKRRLSDKETELETTQRELEDLKKIASGETTVSQDLATRLEKLQQKYERLLGERESGERAKKEFAEAEKKLLDAHDVLLKYMPRGEDEEEWLKHGDEFGMSASLSQQFADRFMKISRTYIKFREAYEG